VNSKDAEGFQPIHLASYTGNDQLVRFLIEHGASLNTPSPKSGYTPIFLAASQCKFHTLKLLLEHGADLNAVAPEGATLLHVSAGYGAFDIVKFLLEKGFPLEQLDDNKATPFLYSCISGNLELVLFFLKSGANIHQRTKQKESCIHLAVNQPSIMLEFLNRGIFVDSAKEDKETPLHLALREGQWRTAKILIERGANISSENSEGKTPIEVVNPKIANELFFYLNENGFLKDADKDSLPENQTYNKKLLSAIVASVLVFTAVLKRK